MAHYGRQPLSVEYALLGLLEDTPAHPYEVHQRLIKASPLSHVWRIKRGHTYALLGRLEEEGLLTSWLESQDAKPPRKMLALTREGRETFTRWMYEPVRKPREMRLTFLAKLYFATRKGTASELVAAQYNECRRWLSDLESVHSGVDTYEQMVLEFRRQQVRSIMAWLSTCRKMINRKEGGDVLSA